MSGTDEGTEQTGSEEVNEVENEARLGGWVGKEEFRGNENDWIDADTFVRRGKEINPILRKNNERLMAELRKRDTELQELRTTMTEFSEHHRKLTETAYKRAMADVKLQLRTARREGDDDLADNLEDQMETLKAESEDIKVPSLKKKEEAAPDAAQHQAILSGWVQDNPWYSPKAPGMVATADGIAMRLAKERPDLLGTRGFLDAVTAEMKSYFPDLFKNKAREAGSPVGGSRTTQSKAGPKGKSYTDLPADAKAACDRFVKDIPGYTKEKYLTDYFGD